MKKILSMLLAIACCLVFSACKEQGKLLAEEEAEIIVSEAIENKDEASENTQTNSEGKEQNDIPNNSNPSNNSTTQKEPNANNTKSHVCIYEPATCTSPEKCSCGKTRGNSAGHKYKSATCIESEKCSVCGETNGSALGHSYNNGSCQRCGVVDPAKRLGSRTNPAKIGDVMTTEINKYFLGEGTIEISLTKVVRGEQARKYVKNSNMFNPEPDAGFEFVLAYFSVKTVSDKSEGQIGIEVNTTDFAYANSNYKAVSVRPGETALLMGATYEGITNNGFVCFSNPIGEDCYIVFEVDHVDKSKDIWFSLK